MRHEVAAVVHRVIAAGLELKERRDRGEALDLEKEQAILRGMLNDEVARRYPEYMGDAISDNTLLGNKTHLGKASEDPFLGIRYALVCWLDEIFTEDLGRDWDREWNERTLEAEFYRSRIRAFNFWHQARKAEVKPGDPLEVYYLGVMLGFRGDLRDDLEKLQNWVAAARAGIARSQANVWKPPEGIVPPTFVPPFDGRNQFQKMVVIGGVVLLALLLLATIFFTSKAFQV